VGYSIFFAGRAEYSDYFEGQAGMNLSAGTRLVSFTGEFNASYSQATGSYDPRVAGLQVDCLVPFTLYGLRQFERAEEALQDEYPGLTFPMGEVIPHGVETRNFHPLPGGRTAARRARFPERPELENAFWVLNANRNQPRKRIDTTLEAFARFAGGREDIDEAFFYELKDGKLQSGKPFSDRLAVAEALGYRVTPPESSR